MDHLAQQGLGDSWVQEEQLPWRPETYHPGGGASRTGLRVRRSGQGAMGPISMLVG